MTASENQIVVCQPNETVRLDVRLENETMECCHCENVARANVANCQLFYPPNVFL